MLDDFLVAHRDTGAGVDLRFAGVRTVMRQNFGSMHCDLA